MQEREGYRSASGVSHSKVKSVRLNNLLHLQGGDLHYRYDCHACACHLSTESPSMLLVIIARKACQIYKPSLKTSTTVRR